MTDKPTFLVIKGSNKSSQDLCGELYEKIKELIYSYSDQMPLAAAIGVLYILQSDILREAEET